MGCPGCVDVEVLLAGHSVPCVLLCHLNVQQVGDGDPTLLVKGQKRKTDGWRAGEWLIQPHLFGPAQGLDSTKASFSPRDAKEHGLGPQTFLLKNNSGTAPGVRRDIMI